MKNIDVEILTLKEYLDRDISKTLPVDIILKLKNLDSNIQLAIKDHELGLIFLDDLKPYFLDINQKFQQLKKSFQTSSKYDELLARALGYKRGNPDYLVLDATAGLLSDSLLMRAMDIEVFATERNPLVSTFLLHSLKKADDSFLKKFHFFPLDAEHFIKENLSIIFDAILFDPMYSHPSEKSKPKKEMQLLREFIGHEDTGLMTAKNLCGFCKRLVIKRPIKAPSLLEKPDLEFKGKSTRYDVYLKK